jgi:hypothetical protein
MKLFLFFLAVVSALMGVLHLVVAKSAIHEIAAYVLFLTSCVGFAGAGVIEAIHQLRTDVVSGGTSRTPGE